MADLNGDDRDGFGYLQLTQRDGLRCSAATAFVHPVADRPHLRLLLEAQVSGLVLEGSRAVGVTAWHAGRPMTVRAAREVVLAAGAYHSPQLLMLAGIGPARHLRSLGIEVRCDLPVGLNLQDHLRIAVVFPTSLATLPRELDAQGRDAYQRHGTLPPMANAGETGGFIRSSAGSASLDFCINGVTTAVGAMLSTGGDGVSVVGWTTRPTSSGRVRLRSADPADRPAVRHDYLATDEDRRSAVDGVVRMLEIADQPAFQEVVSGAPLDAPGDRDDNAVLAWVRCTGVSMHHPCGTCAIGTVVDPELRVLGVDGLRVVDASVMPSIPGATINATTIMIGERGADLLAARTPGVSSSR